jgi:pentatricopeptide repeat protein
MQSFTYFIPVKQILGLMEQFGIKPDIVTYSHQLNAFSSLSHMSKCMKIFDKMIEAGIEPDPQVYSILAKGHVRSQQPESRRAPHANEPDRCLPKCGHLHNHHQRVVQCCQYG